ncbi:condensation domain-containing protein [Saccharothrix deserti]|uniref:condensation domain-containing protein n=1 Tax=Saccharothrix deserti TaxID=2593674 RepID=UPI00131D4E3B|nr:condensation domain-containing protein [Saccharothrix deserti]
MSEPSLSRRYRDRFTALTGGERASAEGLLPATSAQRRFVLGAESTGRRILVPYAFTLPAGALTVAGLADRLAALVSRHAALRCRVDYDDTGLVVQRELTDPTPPTTVVAVAGAREEAEAVRRVLAEARTAPDATPMRVALLRGAEQDRLVLVFEHSVMDEMSLRLVAADLFAAEPAPRPPTDTWREYRDAVWQWLDSEVEAATEDAVGYWVDRLAPVAGVTSSGPATPDPVTAAVVDPAPVELPGPRVRATLFPRLLAAAHQTLQAVEGGASSVIYPWGMRPPELVGVVGCFMNTVFSGEMGAAWRWQDFSRACWLDFEHAHVPFDDVVLAVNRRTRTGWSGEARCLLGLEDLTTRPAFGPTDLVVDEWLPTWLVPKSPVNATARFDGAELVLRVVADPVAFPSAGLFAEVWRERVSRQLAR